MNKFMCHIPMKSRGSLRNYLDLNVDTGSTFSENPSFFKEADDSNREMLSVSGESLLSKDSFHDEEEFKINEQTSKWKREAQRVSLLWGIHRFEKNPWSSKTRPFTRIKHFESLKKTDKEKQGILSRRMIGCCLTYLERSPYDMRYALCKCQLPEKALVDISVLRTYHYIQYLDLSHNKLTTLKALSEMPFLQYLDVSHNFIEVAFDFPAPLYLTTMNYSNNRITRMPDMSQYWSITSLDMSFNCIREIKGIQNLKYLLDLNLSYNKITIMENLEDLRLIRLNLSHNKIQTGDTDNEDNEFRSMTYLTSVDFSYNALQTLKFLQFNEGLEDINISNNDIFDLLEIYYLRNMGHLKSLNMSENRVCEKGYFKTLCIRTLKRLRELNEAGISAEERLEITIAEEDFSPLIPAHYSDIQNLVLEQLNRPKIGDHVIPVGDPTPSLIVIVGPPASRKKEITEKYIEHCDFLKLGLSYTTRSRRKSEVDGKDFYYISRDEFISKIKNAEFVTVSEFNGHLYGIAYKELEKAKDAILVFYADLHTGLILTMAGLNPKLILALPRKEKNHIKWLKETYFFDEHNTPLAEIEIKSAPTLLKEVLYDENEYVDVDMLVMEEDDDSFELGDVSSTIVNDNSEIRRYSSQSIQLDEDGISKQKQPEQIENDIDDSVSETQVAPSPYSTNESEITTEFVEDQSSERQSSCIQLETHKQVLSWKNYDKGESIRRGSGQDSNVDHHGANHKMESIGGKRGLSFDTSKEQSHELEHNQNQESKRKDNHADSANNSGILKRSLTPDEQIEQPAKEENLNNEGELRLVAAKRGASWQTIDVDELFTEVLQTSDSYYDVPDSESCASGANTNGDTLPAGPTNTIATANNVEYNDKYPDENQKEKQKRVSFNAGNDNGSYDDSFLDIINKKEIKSVSNTHILRTMQNRFFDNPLLSVLSATGLTIDDEDYDVYRKEGSLGSKAKTIYTTLAQRFDILKSDKLGPFLARIMLLRRQMLTLHFENPGLFQTVIFTDENYSSSMSALKEITKHLVETHNLVSKSHISEDADEYHNYISKKLDDLKIYKTRYNDLYENIHRE